MEKEKIKEIVLTQVREIILTFEEGNIFEVNENTILFGSGSSIDSLSLVSVIVDLEALFSDEHGFDISLTDDRAMTREISPFDSVISLVDYIFEIINEKQNNQ
jgi:acyl carrier protein